MAAPDTDSTTAGAAAEEACREVLRSTTSCRGGPRPDARAYTGCADHSAMLRAAARSGARDIFGRLAWGASTSCLRECVYEAALGGRGSMCTHVVVCGGSAPADIFCAAAGAAEGGYQTLYTQLFGAADGTPCVHARLSAAALPRTTRRCLTPASHPHHPV